MSESKHPFPRMRDLELYPLEERESLVQVRDFCSVPDPVPGFDVFVDALPDIYAGADLKALVGRILRARAAGKPVVAAMGAHVLKVGLAPLIIDLMERGVITHVALNSAGAIHDFEIATVGRTSERVDTQLPAGRFGFADETGRGLAEAARLGAAPGDGEEPGLGRGGDGVEAPPLLEGAPRGRPEEGRHVDGGAPEGVDHGPARDPVPQRLGLAQPVREELGPGRRREVDRRPR